MPAIIRKLVTLLDETRREMRRELATPIRRVVCCAVIENPFAGRYAEALDFLAGYVKDKQYDIRFALEPKPNEPRGDTLLPTVGHMLAFIERLDRTYDMHRSWTGQDFGDRLPSEVFREHFLTCFISDEVGVQLRDRIGIDSICWELDYPHSDTSWPTPAEQLVAVTTGAVTGRQTVPVDLDMLADILEGDLTMGFGGYLDLTTAQAWPEPHCKTSRTTRRSSAEVAPARKPLLAATRRMRLPLRSQRTT